MSWAVRTLKTSLANSQRLQAENDELRRELERLRLQLDEVVDVVSAVRSQMAGGMRSVSYVDHRLGQIVHDPAAHTTWSYHTLQEDSVSHAS